MNATGRTRYQTKGKRMVRLIDRKERKPHAYDFPSDVFRGLDGSHRIRGNVRRARDADRAARSGAGGSQRDRNGIRGMRLVRPPWTLWALSAGFLLSARMAFRSVRQALLPQSM